MTPVKTVTPVQPDLPGTPKPETVKSVRNGMLLAQYVRPHFGKDNQDEYIVGMEFSFPLTKEHEDYIPEDILRLWKVMKSGSPRRSVDLAVDPQVVEIFYGPDMKPEISILFAEITNASLTIVEETGQGKARDVIRYSFRVQHPSDGDENLSLREFACCQYDKQVWLKMTDVQGSLLKEYRKKQAEAEKDKD